MAASGTNVRRPSERPLKRFLQGQIETKLARALIAGEVTEGAEVKFSVKDDELAMK